VHDYLNKSLSSSLQVYMIGRDFIVEVNIKCR